MERVKITVDAQPLSVPDSVISRIKKFLAVATRDNNSDHEAALAMAKAQELLTAYNLSVASLEAYGNPTAKPVDKRVKEETSIVATYRWQTRLWRGLAEANFCLYWTTAVLTEYQIPDPNQSWYYNLDDPEEYKECPKIWVTRTTGKKHYLVGRESNVAVTKAMAEYLEAELGRLCPHKGNSTKGLSWKGGATEKLVYRLNQKKIELIKAEKKHAQEVAASAGALIRLEDVYTSEYDLNVDLEFGEGTAESWRKQREENSEKFRKNKEIRDNPKAYTADQYADAMKYFGKLERDSKARSRARGEYTGDDNIDYHSWFSGREAGENIGLDPQVGKGKGQKRIA